MRSLEQRGFSSLLFDDNIEILLNKKIKDNI